MGWHGMHMTVMHWKMAIANNQEKPYNPYMVVKSLSAEIDANAWRQLRMEALRRGVPIYRLVGRILADWVAANTKEEEIHS